MKLNNAIRVNLVSFLDFTDSIVAKIDENKKKITDLVQEIIEKDKKGEKTDEQIITHRALMSYSMLLNDDLVKGLTQLSVYYKLAKIGEVDLGLGKEDLKRLDFLVQQDKSYFALDKGKITPKDKDLFKKLVDRISANQEFTTKDFLKSLRKSKIYGG